MEEIARSNLNNEITWKFMSKERSIEDKNTTNKHLMPFRLGGIATCFIVIMLPSVSTI